MRLRERMYSGKERTIGEQMEKSERKGEDTRESLINKQRETVI